MATLTKIASRHDECEEFRNLCDSHEALRAERDAALAEVDEANALHAATCEEIARMRPVVEAAELLLFEFAPEHIDHVGHTVIGTTLRDAIAAYRAAQPRGGTA